MPQKDYHGIAASGFSHSLRGNKEDRNSDMSLIEQLEKFGTDKEKRAIRMRKLEAEDQAKRVQVYDAQPEPNAFI